MMDPLSLRVRVRVGLWSGFTQTRFGKKRSVMNVCATRKKNADNVDAVVSGGMQRVHIAVVFPPSWYCTAFAKYTSCWNTTL